MRQKRVMWELCSKGVMPQLPRTRILLLFGFDWLSIFIYCFLEFFRIAKGAKRATVVATATVVAGTTASVAMPNTAANDSTKNHQLTSSTHNLRPTTPEPSKCLLDDQMTKESRSKYLFEITNNPR